MIRFGVHTKKRDAAAGVAVVIEVLVRQLARSSSSRRRNDRRMLMARQKAGALQDMTLVRRGDAASGAVWERRRRRTKARQAVRSGPGKVPLGAAGLRERGATLKPSQGRSPALLLDRDGVVNDDHGYVATPERFDFCNGIFALIHRAIDCGYRIVIITNQSGIARGYYSEPEFHQLMGWMEREFAQQGIQLSGIFHCPYLPGAVAPEYDRDSFWRKPNPGMILEAARRLDLDLAHSIFVGDQPSDMAAASAAGIARRVLIRPVPVHATGTGEADLVIGRLADLTARLPWSSP